MTIESWEMWELNLFSEVPVDVQPSAAKPLPAVSRLAALTVRARKTMVAEAMLVKVSFDVESQEPHKV